jgi:hypothetical protein
MPVYVDPTETREGTRLPQSVIKMAKELPGLEQKTGADFLVTPADIALPVDITRKNDLTRMVLERACEHGILVQRKSGGDFVQSIPHLSGIQERMLHWAHPGGCILLVTGLEFRGQYVMAGGRQTQWTAASVKGAFRAWRFRGGHIETLPGDDQIVPWLSEMHEVVTGFAAEPVNVASRKEAVQRLVNEPLNWVTTGHGFPPGIGRAKRESIARAVSPSSDPIRNPPPLARVLNFITSGKLTEADGIGKVLLFSIREWYGISSDRRLRDIPGFKSITMTFPEDLPVRLSGDGIEVVPSDEGIAYRFSSYTALETLDLVLSAMDWRAGQKG